MNNDASISGESTLVIAVRHGETAWNVDGRIQGQLDVPLNEQGRRQARRLARALAGQPIAAVYSSDLSRAHETARSAASGLGLGVTLHQGLRERHFGMFQGCTYSEIADRWPELSKGWRQRDPAFGPEGGETLQDFYDRSVDTATELAKRHVGQAIILAAHGGVLDCLYRAASRMTLNAQRTWHLGNATINRLLHTPQGFTLVGWNDDRHLDDPSLDDKSVADGALPSAALGL